MILLDTNVISELMKPSPDEGVMKWLDDQFISTIFTCAIVRAEIEMGIALLPMGDRKRGIAEAALRVFSRFSNRCLVFDELAAIEYAQIVVGRTKIGRPIKVEDAQIAAIALVGDLELATRNSKDFEDIPGLVLINPWQI